MDVIYAYLDTMFSPYASSPRLDAAKEELRGMMEDAYSARVAQGNSHNEAVGAVITEFGNLDELAEVLGISTELNRMNSAHDDARNATSPGSAAPDSDDAAARGANPASAQAPRTAPSDARPGAFAANGRAASRTPSPKAPKADSTTGSAASDFTATRFIDPDAQAHQPGRPSHDRGQWRSCGRKEGNWDEESGTRVDVFAAIFWPVITAVYLLWSFIWHAWGVSWIIWPVSGLLFGPAVIIASAWLNRRDKRRSSPTP